MGNSGSQSSRSNSQSRSYSSSTKISNTDSRAYQNTDSRSYQKTDSRSYKNIDSRDMSTNVNNVDNSNISETALDCGVNPSDVENYTNDESININQDNSQNIVVTGDGNTLENVSQKMNLTSYGPTVQKCMQDAVTKMASANKTDLSAKKANAATAKSDSKNTSGSSSDNTSGVSNKISNEQSSSNTQKSDQTTKQSSELSQTAGFGSGNGGFEIVLIMIIVLVVFYSSKSLDNNDSNPLRLLTEYFETSFNSTHLVIALLLLVIMHESLNN
jgi:trimeric autotransporter adhesin